MFSPHSWPDTPISCRKMNNAEQIGFWYDDIGDILTVTWENRSGYYIDSNDDRVQVRVDPAGNAIGFMVQGFSAFKDKSLEIRHGMDWWNQLGKDKSGSRPRCVLLTDSNRAEVAKRLTCLVGLPGVVVSPNDRWMPYGKPVKEEDDSWDLTPANEAQLGNPKLPNDLVSPDTHRELTAWWIKIRRGKMTTPNWDIASTCTIKGKQGLLLVEAKAHGKELRRSGKNLGKDPSEGEFANHDRIGEAISEASAGLQRVTKETWKLSRDSHYQLANRFAWSWKLASLGIPVILVYLGFLDAQDMANQGRLFGSDEDWEQEVKEYGEGVLDNDCWGQWLDVEGTPFVPLIRTYKQPFKP